MENYAWILWTLLGVVLIVAETFTLGFFLLWFGVGALAAALMAYLGFGAFWQFIIFVIVSTGLTAATRKIFSHKLALGSNEDYKTNIDTLPGKVGTVTEASGGVLNEGAVKVYGSIWTAFPIDGETPLLAGEKVEVVRVEGASIYVQKVRNELPGWRQE